MADTKKLKVVYEPDEGGWHAFVPDVQGCRTWGRTLQAARRNVREALSTCSDVLEQAEQVAEQAELEEEFRLPADVSALLQSQQQARRSAEQASEQLRSST